jgi:hypothetical protein
MTSKIAYSCLGWLLMTASAVSAEEIRFPVRHDHTFGSCQGELIFKEDGVDFITPEKKHARAWKYEDIQQLGMLSPQEIVILTYEDRKWELGRDRDFRFQVTKGTIPPSLATRLRARLARPLISALLTPESTPEYQIPVKHERGFSGSQGVLEVSDQFLLYRTDAKGDSRAWRYEDIASIGTTGPYQLRLTSMDRVQGEYGGDRNFVFTLKRKLDPKIYDYIWWKINGPQISTASRK